MIPRFLSKTQRVGNSSLMIIIPADIVKYKNLREGMMVHVDLIEVDDEKSS